MTKLRETFGIFDNLYCKHRAEYEWDAKACASRHRLHTGTLHQPNY